MHFPFLILMSNRSQGELLYEIRVKQKLYALTKALTLVEFVLHYRTTD